MCEYQTTGVDEYLQGRGGEALGFSGVGLRVPPLVTPTFDAGGASLRYLFLLFAIPIYESEAVRIEYLKQLLTLWALAGPNRPEEMLVGGPGGNPAFQMPGAAGGSVAWHLRLVPHNAVGPFIQGPLDSNNFKFRMGLGPALLYKTATFPAGHLNLNGRPDFYTSMTSYVPPNQGRPYGVPITPELGTFFDIRFPPQTQPSPRLGIIVPGPGLLCGFASVRQAVGVAAPGDTNDGHSAEENFIINYPGGQQRQTLYGRIGMTIGVRKLSKSRWEAA